MVRGLYSAAAGIFTQQKSLNTISNNIANASTAGFKSQATIESSFGEHLINRMSKLESLAKDNIGSWSYITVNSSEYTDYTQGSLENTGRPVDMAINGDGFFLVESETYGPVLTRNGQFEIDADGELCLPGVGKVLNGGESTISLESGNFTVSPAGTIYVDGDEADSLYIVRPGEDTVLRSVGNGVFQVEEGGSYDQAEEGTYQVLQGMLEKSNINIAQEMTRIIAGQSRYNSCAQIIKIYDKINEITVSQIGRIG
jgi:flagellar basal-body rod protein FlgF